MSSSFKIRFGRALHKLRPRTRVAWFTLYVGGLEVFLVLLRYALKLFGALDAASAVLPWSNSLLFLLCALLIFLGLRWFRQYVMWRLRNRLIVTYLFIGGVPIFLVVLMAAIAGYLLTGQFAIFLALSRIDSNLQELEAANLETAHQIARSNQAARTGSAQVESLFPGQISQLFPESSLPKWVKENFRGLVLDHSQIYLRAVNMVKRGDKEFALVSSVPVDKEFLSRLADQLGPLTLVVPVTSSGDSKLNVEMRPGEGLIIRGDQGRRISAGSLPPPQFRGDPALDFAALIQPTTWDNGQASSTFMLGTVRLSTLYSRLSVSVTRWAEIVQTILAILAIIFGVILLIALIIGVRLTRTMTRSVANLYKATEHINRGDFSHRIQVKERDQLATLQVSFNSMTESLEKLIAEQKEKERLQSELAIAQEVQAQLFPKAISGTGTLELSGVCRPARIVSGDYYDFLSYGSEQMGIAVGDISGKGISAALLMATIHSAVRAYEQEQLIPITAGRSSIQNARSGSVALAMRNSPPQSPSQVLWLLNQQLYKTTQPEKYATLFLGFYDGHVRQLTYSNAGHLPPLILGENGSIRRLETGGTVVGLFENIEYQESSVELYPGDIFVAFSDGIIEPENEFGEFGEERLIEAIEAHRNLPLDRITDNVIAAVQDWIGSAEQPDDITLVLARPRATLAS